MSGTFHSLGPPREIEGGGRGGAKQEDTGYQNIIRTEQNRTEQNRSTQNRSEQIKSGKKGSDQKRSDWIF
eukprot:729046-Hanusia_phi.AAC.3